MNQNSCINKDKISCLLYIKCHLIIYTLAILYTRYEYFIRIQHYYGYQTIIAIQVYNNNKLIYYSNNDVYLFKRIK